MSGTGVKQWTIQRGRGHYSTPWTPLSHTPGYLTTRRYANTVFTLPSGRATVVTTVAQTPQCGPEGSGGPLSLGKEILALGHIKDVAGAGHMVFSTGGGQNLKLRQWRERFFSPLHTPKNLLTPLAPKE